MKRWGTRLLYGIALWAILYALSIPLLPLQGTDLAAFKATMACLGILFGSLAAMLYFRGVERDFLRDSVYTALTWMAVNWLLDVLALLPFTHQDFFTYFHEIGIEYVGMFGMLVAIGYLLDKKVPKA